MRPVLLRIALVPSVLFMACDFRVTSAPAERVAVLQGVLLTDRPQQSVWVEWATPADSTYGLRLRPVDPGVVALTLRLPSGDSVTFNAAADSPGRFDASVQVGAGEIYRLSGAVAGVRVAAEVRVPDPLIVVSPRSDTVLVRSNSAVGIVWRDNGAALYGVHEQLVPSSWLSGTPTSRDTTWLIQNPANVDTIVVWVLALDPNVAHFEEPGVQQEPTIAAVVGNVQGALGFLGAASVARRTVIWRD